MRTSVSSTSLLWVTNLLFLLIGQVELGPSTGPKFYKIKKYGFEKLPDALSYLRGFLNRTLSPEERCQKYAIMMDIKRSTVIDQFSIANIALANAKWAAQQVEKMDLDKLRDLYIEGIEESLAEGPVDSSLFELFICLGDQFRLIDAKARSFLNLPGIQLTMSQYKSIMNQPLKFLIDKQVKHPSLSSQELLPSNYRTALSLFNGDALTVESKFPTHKPEPEPEPTLEPEIQPEPEIVQELEPEIVQELELEKASPVFEGVSEPEPEPKLEPETQPEPELVQELEPEKASSMFKGASEPEPERTIEEPAASEVDHSSIPDHEDHVRDAQPRLQTTELLEPDANIPDSLPPKLVQALEKAGLNPAAIEHLGRLPKALDLLHINLPAGISYYNRCRAYSEIIGSDSKDINEARISQILAEAIANEGSASRSPLEPFVPDQEAVHDFLWTLEKLGHRLLGADVWVSLADCVAPWVESHPEARAFLNGDVTNEIMKQIVDDAQQRTEQAAVEHGLMLGVSNRH